MSSPTHNHGCCCSHDAPERNPGLATLDEHSSALASALSSGLKICRVIAVGVFVLILFSGVVTIQPNEVGIILRFGKPVQTSGSAVLQPGLHFAFPYPVDEVVRIPVSLSQKIVSSNGWYYVTPEMEASQKDPEARNALRPGIDGYMLTADDNILHIRSTLRYRITDPVAYWFHFKDSATLLDHDLNNALIHTAAEFTADAALYRNKVGFRDAVFEKLSDRVALQHLGAIVESIEVQVSAPMAVRPAFEQVLSAEQERSQKINESLGYSNEVVIKSVGESNSMVNSGISASNQIVLAVAAEAGFFNAQLPHYQKNPVLFQRRILVETIERIMTNATDKFILPAAAGGQSREVRLQLNREPPAPSTNQTNID